jgi:hypothetical protein
MKSYKMLMLRPSFGMRTRADLRRVFKMYMAFVRSGYRILSNCFGHIAHYDREQFYSYCGCGTCIVSRGLFRIHRGFHGLGIIRSCLIHEAEVDEKERAELKRLREKYGW